jgi:alcohol dehydrogenase
VHDVKTGDHVCFTNVSCGRLALPEGSYIWRASVSPRGHSAGHHRRISTAKPVNHQSASPFAEYAGHRGSVVVIDPTLPLDIAALFGCAVVTGVGAGQHREDPARQLGGCRGPGRRGPERPDGRGSGGRQSIFASDLSDDAAMLLTSAPPTR